MKRTYTIKRIERTRNSASAPFKLLLLCQGFSFSVPDTKKNQRAFAIGREVDVEIRLRGPRWRRRAPP